MPPVKVHRAGVNIKNAFNAYAKQVISLPMTKRSALQLFLGSLLFIKIRTHLRPIVARIYYFMLNHSLYRSIAIKVRLAIFNRMTRENE